MSSDKTSNQFARERNLIIQGQIWRFLVHSLTKYGQITVKVKAIVVEFWLFFDFSAQNLDEKFWLDHEAQIKSYEFRSKMTISNSNYIALGSQRVRVVFEEEISPKGR